MKIPRGPDPAVLPAMLSAAQPDRRRAARGGGAGLRRGGEHPPSRRSGRCDGRPRDHSEPVSLSVTQLHADVDRGRAYADSRRAAAAAGRQHGSDRPRECPAAALAEDLVHRPTRATQPQGKRGTGVVGIFPTPASLLAPVSWPADDGCPGSARRGCGLRVCVTACRLSSLAPIDPVMLEPVAVLLGATAASAGLVHRLQIALYSADGSGVRSEGPRPRSP